jgi:hypothetical protein
MNDQIKFTLDYDNTVSVSMSCRAHFTTLKNKQTCPVCNYLKTIKPKFDFIANQSETKHENV